MDARVNDRVKDHSYRRMTKVLSWVYDGVVGMK